ncbi:MAG: HEPN family nuclease [Legionella sp.]|uniref:HEPN family nuclease n=1 Tax=Legionella sp. TaxID=459 RepID=UPI00284352B2|nr:HEPN family nuclease [Legionella sp.]
MEYDDIEIDFVSRTKKLIEQYQGEYEATLLINCCIGLLVLPKEKHLNSIPEVSIEQTGKTWGLSRMAISTDCQECGYKLRNVIRRIRNGICHFKVNTIPDGSGKIVRIKIKDRGRFQVILSIDELKELTFAVADHVINPKQHSERIHCNS